MLLAERPVVASLLTVGGGCGTCSYSKAVQFGPAAVIYLAAQRAYEPEVRRCTAMQKLRIVMLRFGTARLGA
jgi:hypothetical protein